MKTKILFLLITFIAQSIPGYTDTDIDSVLPSTEWQKAALERNIVARLERRLDTVIRNKQYMVDVNITTALPQKPDFKLPQGKPSQNIKFSNATIDDSSGDYIVFSKFGLEVPIIALQDQDKSKEEKSELEYLWKYNQSVNVFKNLENINVIITLSEKLKEDARTKIKELLESADLGTGEVIPSFEFKYTNFALDPVEEPKKKPELPKIPKEPTLWEMAEKFSNSIGLIAATLLFGLIAWMLMSKYETIKKDEQKAQSPVPMPMSNNEDKDDDKDPSTLNAPTPQDQQNITSGIDRFNSYLEKNPHGAYFLVRKWIKAEAAHEKKALFALVKALDNKTLVNLFENISLHDREKWKNIIGEKEAQVSDMKEIDQYISKQVVEEFIVPSLVDDNKLLELVMDLTDVNAARFIEENQELGPYFLQLLNVKHTAAIFKHLQPAMIKSMLKVSAHIKKEEFLNIIPELKRTMPAYTTKGTDNAFVTKLMELIPHSPASKDEALFESLREAGAGMSMMKLAKKYYPSFLIKTLPEGQLNTILSGYRTEKKAELLYVLNDEDRINFITALGPDGSTIREMVKMELENIESNTMIARDLTARADDIWNEFVNYARTQIDANFDAQPVYSETVHQWIKQSPERPNLSVVA